MNKYLIQAIIQQATLDYVPVANTIYIDQTNDSDGRNGSFSKPYNSFSEFTIEDNYIYKIKGTYTTSTPISLVEKTAVTIGSYGLSLAKFDYTGADVFAVKINQSTNCTINLEIDCNGTTQYGIFLGSGSGGTTYVSGTGHTISGKIHNCYDGNSDYTACIIGGGIDITIDDCEAYDSGSDGFYLRNTQNLVIDNSHIHHVNQNYGNANNLGTGASGDGIQLDGTWKNYYIGNTIIDRSDENTGNKFCLILNSANEINATNNGIVEHCTFIAKTGVDMGCSVYVAQGDGNIFRYNTFVGGPLALRVSNYSDPVDTYTDTCLNTLIHNNIFHDCVNGVGVAYGGGAEDNRNTKVYNNTFYHVTGYHVWIDRSYVDLQNNIHCRAGDTGVALYNYGGGTYIISNNCYDVSATAGTPGVGDDYVVGTPNFVDAANHNFRLLSTSPCRNSGANVPITEDFDGVSIPQESFPSIGAFEYTI